MRLPNQRCQHLRSIHPHLDKHLRCQSSTLHGTSSARRENRWIVSPPLPTPSNTANPPSPTGGSNATLPTSILQLLSNTPTPLPPSSKTSAGVIAGATVGAVAGVAIICGGLWFLYLRHRRHPTKEEIPPSPVEKDGASGIVSELSNERRWEMPGWGSGVEMDAERGTAIGHKPDQKPAVELR